jgi:uncharacterized protein YukE
VSRRVGEWDKRWIGKAQKLVETTRAGNATTVAVAFRCVGKSVSRCQEQESQGNEACQALHVVLKMIGEEIRNVSLVSTYEDCEQRQQGQ